MKELIYQARQIAPNFDNLTTQRQYELLRQLEPKITPEDLVYYYEQSYYLGNDENWDKYLQNYIQ